jgi:hypothetical protein
MRNRRAPDALLASMMNEAGNQAALYRSKSVFDAYGLVSAATPLTADEGRWHWAFHTGPMAHALYCVLHMRAQTSATATTGSSSRIDIYDTGGSVVSTQTLNYGVSPAAGTAPAGWEYNKTLSAFLDVDPDTEYTGKLSLVNYGRVIGATVFELPSLTENFDGYLSQSLTIQTPVVDKYREDLATLTRALWRRGGAKVLNWTAHTAPFTTTSTTATNIIDNATTTVSASSPGWTLVMTGKDRLSQTTGVPCVMKVYGRLTGAGTGGNVYLKKSDGSTVTSITNGWSSTSLAWVSVSFNMPLGTDKYDLQYSKTLGAGDFELTAVSIYEHES